MKTIIKMIGKNSGNYVDYYDSSSTSAISMVTTSSTPQTLVASQLIFIENRNVVIDYGMNKNEKLNKLDV